LLSRIKTSRLLATACVVWTALGCATLRRPHGAQPVAAVSAGTAEDAWRDLVSRRSSLTAIQAYVRIRATAGQTSQSLRATLSRDSGQRALVEALTPLGTAAFTLFSDGADALFLDHLSRKFWRGPASSIGSVAGGLVPTVNLAELMLLAVGLPIDSTSAATRCQLCPAEPGRIVIQQGDVRYTVGSAGLASAIVQRGGESLKVDYSPPSFPPSAIDLGRYLGDSTTATQRIELRILDLVTGPAPLQPPAIPAGYTCCAGL
jgi:hypothetical protein